MIYQSFPIILAAAVLSGSAFAHAGAPRTNTVDGVCDPRSAAKVVQKKGARAAPITVQEEGVRAAPATPELAESCGPAG
jgi:hypothetical protein